jgi:hypothetical protein
VVATSAAGTTHGADQTFTTAHTQGAKPRISTASETTKSWREDNALPHVSAKPKPPVGTTFSFALNEPASITLSFTQHAIGRKHHTKCVTQTGKNRHAQRCTRALPAGHLTFTGHPGTNKIRFAGRITHTNKLKPGRYALTITATNPQHAHSPPRSLNFTIVK